MDYLLRSGSEEQASSYSNIGDQYYVPSTSDVLSAFTEESYKGIGTGYADLAALEAERAKRVGQPLTEEDYKASPYYRSSLPYSRDLTTESAKVLAEYNDEREKNAFIINHASTAQTALGYTTGFAAGVFEPKNIATGVVASAALTPIVGSLAPAASSLRRVVQLKKALGRYSDKALIGGVEGMVAAAAAEPSNQYSAGILKQDYTMADTLWNVGLSAAFGVGFNTVPGMIKEKWQAHGTKAPDVAIAELDTAIGQLSQGKRVDVAPVGKAAIGDIANEPVTERAATIEQYLKTQTQDTVAEKLIAPNTDTQKFSNLEDVVSNIKQANVSIFASERDGLITLSKIVVPQEQRNVGIGTSSMEKIIAYADDVGKTIALTPSADFGGSKPRLVKFYRGLGFIENKGKNKDYAISEGMYRPPMKQGLSIADVDTIARRIDTENKAVVNKAVLDDLDPDNDTAIDANAARELDAFDKTLSEEEKAIAENYKKSLEEISFMKKEGLMTDAEIEMFTDAINSVNPKDMESAYDSLLTCLTRG